MPCIEVKRRIHTQRDANRAPLAIVPCKGVAERDACLMLPGHDQQVVTTEERYRVGAMTVTLEVERGVVVETDCECEGFADQKKNGFVTGRNERCKHIRRAEMYRHFEGQVEPVEND